MKKIGIESFKKKSFSSRKRTLHLIFISTLIISFAIFNLYTRITGRIFSQHKIDIFNDLDQIAFYFWFFDRDISNQLNSLDDIIKKYLAGENVLQTKEKEINQIWDYTRNKGDYLSKIGFGNYEKIFQILNDTWTIKEEIFDLLGKQQRFNYLIPLQNTNEARPNGGFFGSFAFIGLSGGHIVDLQIIDSYLPDLLAPNSRIPLPERTQAFLGGKSAGFIAGNKFGFTDKDGKNLKTLYEKIFNYEFDPVKKEKMFNPEKWNKLFQKNIKGVIFLNSELINFLLPSFREKARERQFVNANIDIIRGKDIGNKKEVYIKDLEQYLKKNSLNLAKSAINNTQEFLDKGFINIYLSNVSDKIWEILKKHHLTTIYSPDFWYFFNINTSFNKSDGFVKKEIEISDEKGKVILSTDSKKINTKSLNKGIYHVDIRYSLDIPKTYQDWILSLEEKYHIKMTDRERHILAIQPKNPDPDQPLKRRETKEIIYLPKNTKILSIEGDLFNKGEFNADFAKGVFYKSRITKNQTTNSTRITIQIF